MYCIKCGAEINEGSSFCHNCGKKVINAADKSIDNRDPSEDKAKIASLVKEAIAGSDIAWTDLYIMSYNKAYRTVKAIIRDDSTVEDIVQDSYITALEKLSTLEKYESFEAWIKTIARNKAIDELRKNKKVIFFSELEKTNDEGESWEHEIESDYIPYLPEESIDKKEVRRLIYKILGDLPEDQRFVVGDHYYNEKSVKEIAEAVGVSESTIMSRLSYGRKKVEKAIIELRNQGTYLCGLSAIAFFRALIKTEKTYAMSVPKMAEFFTATKLAESGAKVAIKTLENTAVNTAGHGLESGLVESGSTLVKKGTAKTLGTMSKSTATGKMTLASSAGGSEAATGSAAATTGTTAATGSAAAATGSAAAATGTTAAATGTTAAATGTTAATTGSAAAATGSAAAATGTTAAAAGTTAAAAGTAAAAAGTAAAAGLGVKFAVGAAIAACISSGVIGAKRSLYIENKKEKQIESSIAAEYERRISLLDENDSIDIDKLKISYLEYTNPDYNESDYIDSDYIESDNVDTDNIESDINNEVLVEDETSASEEVETSKEMYMKQEQNTLDLIKYYNDILIPEYGQCASNTVKEYFKTAMVGDGIRKYKVENGDGLIGYKIVCSDVDGRAYMFTSRYQDISEMDRDEGYKTHTVKLVMDVYSVEGDNVQKINKDNMWMRTYGDNTYQMAYAEKEDGIHMYITRNMNTNGWEGGLYTTGIIEYLINDGNMTRISKNNEIDYLNDNDFGFYKNRGILPNIDSKWNEILEKYFYECDENSEFGSLKSNCGEDVNCDGYFVENPFVRELTDTEKDLNMIAYFGRTKYRDEDARWDQWTEEWTCRAY